MNCLQVSQICQIISGFHVFVHTTPSAFPSPGTTREYPPLIIQDSAFQKYFLIHLCAELVSPSSVFPEDLTGILLFYYIIYYPIIPVMLY